MVSGRVHWSLNRGFLLLLTSVYFTFEPSLLHHHSAFMYCFCDVSLASWEISTGFERNIDLELQQTTKGENLGHGEAYLCPLCLLYRTIWSVDWEYITHISRIDFHTVIIRVSPLSFLCASGVSCNYIQFSDENFQSKQNNPRWDAAFCGVTSGTILFAYVS